MMRDYILLVARIMGVEARFEFTTQQELLARFPELTNQRGLSFACRHMCCDITRAREQLGWSPSIRLDVGLSENIAWMREQKII